MDNKINFFILFIGTWILFSIALIANNKYLFENIINIFIFINISLLIISVISSIQRNKDNLFQKKEKELIDYIYKKHNNDNINEKINELLKINININRKKLLIKIEDKLIQMKEKELKNIMMNNLKKNNNITREELKIIIINQKQILEDYKYELKATIILLDLKK
jgi:hypothetical protein